MKNPVDISSALCLMFQKLTEKYFMVRGLTSIYKSRKNALGTLERKPGSQGCTGWAAKPECGSGRLSQYVLGGRHTPPSATTLQGLSDLHPEGETLIR